MSARQQRGFSKRVAADAMAIELAALVHGIEHEGADICTGRAVHALRSYRSTTRDDPRLPSVTDVATSIGECEWCGMLDHNLVAGECPRCRAKSIDFNGGSQE